MPDLAEQIAQAKLLDARKSALEEQLGQVLEELATLNAQFLAAGEKVAAPDEKGTRRAKLVADTGTIQITWPLAPLKLTEENFDAAKELAGPAFAKIAEKVPVTHTLLKAARDLIPALLSKSAAEKLLKLLAGKPGAPRVAYS